MKFVSSDILTARFGNVPIIFLTHHDGQKDSIRGVELEKIRNTYNDLGSYYFVERLEHFFERYNLKNEFSEISPYFLKFRIKKSRSTEDMFTMFYFKLFELIGECFGKWGKVYIFDIHRFFNIPIVEGTETNCDMWFGTDYRKSVTEDFDYFFANILKVNAKNLKENIKIWVPEETPKDGERFMATGKYPSRRIVTNKISNMADLLHIKGSVDIIQIEIYKDWLLKNKRTDVLANIFGWSIVELVALKDLKHY